MTKKKKVVFIGDKGSMLSAMGASLAMSVAEMGKDALLFDKKDDGEKVKRNSNDKKIFVFDVDGTLSDPTMREGLLRRTPKNWVEFKSRALEDPPHEDIIWLLRTFYEAGHTILIATARTEDERPYTEKWFENHGVAGFYHKMYMREDKDYRDDSIIKSEMLERIIKEYGTPFMVFDDRNRVVDMWRRLGVRCLQVAPGDF